MNRRVVITGLGIVASNGIGKDDFWRANVEGRSGVDRIERFNTEFFQTKIAAEIKDFHSEDFMEEQKAKKMDRFSQFAIASTKLAIQDGNYDLEKDDPYRVGVILGSGLGGMFFYEKQILTMQKKGRSKVHPASIIRVMPNAPAGQVSIELKLKGPNLTISTACTSGSHAIGQAFELIKNDKAEIMFSGGTEAPIVYYNYAGFDALQVMSKHNDMPTEACRPFDKNRDGFVMGEGSAVLILEELEHALNRSAKIYAEIIGYGLTSGAQHMVMPVESGEDAARTMKNALDDADIRPEEVDYINAHGTATLANDKSETKAIKKVFGDYAYKLPVSSTKSIIGHSFGAAGAMELVIGCLTIENNLIPPTINYKTHDLDCDLDYVSNEARQKKVRTVLSNSFGFGGNNTALILTEYIS